MRTSKKYSNFNRVLALFLSVVMLLMQAPMGVFAVDASVEETVKPTGVLELDSSVTVESETLFAFTPEESGVYCFYSTSGEDTDPKMRLLDENKKQLAQDDDGGEGLNFELHYELTAGTTYYVEAGAYSNRYPYTLTVEASDLASIEIVSIPTFEVEEYDMLNGHFTTVYQDEIVDRYFVYYPYEAMYQAVIKVNYKNGTSEEVAFYDEDKEWTGISMDWDFYNDPWTVGSDNHYYITYKGMKALANATVVASPVTNIELVSIENTEFVELDESTGYWSNYYQDLELDEEYFCYATEAMLPSIKLSVTYADGSTEQVSYLNDKEETTGIRIYSDQYQQPWSVGENEFEIWYKGACVTATATVVESDVESIRVIAGGSFEYTEFDTSCGYWMGEEAFYYYPDRFMQDIVLEVTYTDGSTEEIAAMEENSGVVYRDTQHDTPWTVDGDNELRISYKGVSTTAHVTVKPGIVESISIENVVVTEGTHGSWWGQELPDGSKDTWYHYDIFAENITVTLSDGTTLRGNQEHIWEQLGVSVTFNSESYQHYEGQWGVGEYKVTASLMGKKTEFLFVIVESDVVNISVSNVELQQNQNGNWRDGYWDNNGEWVEAEWFYYLPQQLAQITVTFKDDTVFTGTIDQLDMEYGMRPQIVESQSYQNQWQAGQTYTAKVYLCGKSAEFSVTIAESNITSIEVIDTQGFVYYENDTSNGEWHDDFFWYSAWELASRVTIRVTYKDGTTEDISYFDEYGNYCDISYSEKQYETPWTVGGENLLTIMYGGAKTTISAAVQQSPIASIVVDRITHTQYTNGHWNEDGYWDENDNWVSTGRYYHYSTYPQNITITYTDGRVVSGNPDEIEKQTGIRPQFDALQGGDSPWGIGDHTATLTFMGKTVEYIISIEESNIASVTAPDITHIEGTGGWWNEYYEDDAVAGYYYYYNCMPDEITVTYKDGSSITGTREEIGQQTGWYPEIMVNQGPDNQWGVGTYSVTVSYMGATGEFAVVINASPVASIVVEPVTYTEYTNGEWRYHYTEEGEQQYYFYHVYPNKVTINYADGTTISGYPYEIQQQTGYDVSISFNQDYDNQWGVGTYTATVSFIADVTIDIVEEGTKGYWSQNEYGEYNFYYYFSPQSITVEFTDGTQFTGTYDALNEQVEGQLSFGAMQGDGSWGVGTHTATLTCMGTSVEYDIVITPTQIESVTVLPIIAVAGEDGWNNSEYYDQVTGSWQQGEWYEYNAYPEMMIVTFKDGSVFTGNHEDFNALGYVMRLEHDQEYRNPWGTGVHPVTLVGVGFGTSYVVEILEKIEGEQFSYVVLSDGTAALVGYHGSAVDLIIPNTIDGYTVTVITSYFIEYSDVQSLTIPATVRRIENYAFGWNYSLQTVRIYAGVEMIGKYAFVDCTNLENVIFFGTEQEAENAVVFAGNECLKNAQWRYAAECTEHEYDDACDAECNICYAVREPEHAYEWVIGYPGNCVEAGWKYEQCTLCEATRNHDTVIPAKGEHTNTELRDERLATCNQYGYTGDLFCLDCQQYVSYGQSIDPTEHLNTELLDARPATCGQWGYSGDVYCRDCNTYIENGEPIEPTGQHQNTDVTNVTEATCSSTGYTGDIYCYDCGNILALGEDIPMKDHENTEIIGEREATCGQAGYTGDLYCNDCGNVVQYGEEIPATGNHGALTVIHTAAATCNKPGYTGDVFCNACQTVVQYGQEISATGNHVYDNGYDADCNECGAVREVTLRPAVLSLSGGTAYQGETIRVDISIDGNTGFAGLQLGVLYDDTYLTLKDVETQMEDFVVTVDKSIVFDSFKNHTADGVIATLVFEVAQDAPIGEYNVQLRFMSGSTEDFEAVVMTDSAATIKVESAVAGDANGDGEVDTADLVMLRRYLASMDPVTMTSEIAVKKGADTNDDGAIDAIDLAFVRQYLASMPVS